MDVVLRKMSKKTGAPAGRPVVGRLVRPPRKGAVLVVEFSDGLHEYVTTPIKRVLKFTGREVYYIETANSRYRLEVRSGVLDSMEAAR